MNLKQALKKHSDPALAPLVRSLPHLYGTVRAVTVPRPLTPAPQEKIVIHIHDIHLNEEKIADVLVKSDDKLSRYASPSGEAVFPTSAHIVTANKPG